MKLVVELRLAWWARAYLASVLCFARWTGMDPDSDKVIATTMRGVKTRVRKEP